MSASESVDKTLELTEMLPFMQAFPFNEYETVLELEGVDPLTLGISQILIDKLGTFGSEYQVNFLYSENNASSILISLYLEDILDVLEISHTIKKLDSVLEDINIGLTSNSIEIKIKQIKKSRRFLKLLNSESLFSPQFKPVLHELLQASGVVLTSAQMLMLHKLQTAKLMDQVFSKKELDSVFAYLNFQLHYAKILLGIVISIKIY